MSAYLLNLVASEASTIVRPAKLYYNINIVAILGLEISLILAPSLYENLCIHAQCYYRNTHCRKKR